MPRILLLLGPILLIACPAKDHSDEDDDGDDPGGWDLGTDTGITGGDAGSSGDGGSSDGGSSDGGSSDGGSSDGGSSDGGSSDGGSSDGGSDDYGTSSCSPFAPVDLTGLDRLYEYIDDDAVERNTYQLTYEGLDDYRGEEVWLAVANYVSLDTWGDPSYVYTEDRYYRCDDEGVWLLGTYQVSEWLSGTYEGEINWYSRHYTTPGLIAPASYELGDSWTYSAEYTYDSSSGSGGPLTSEADYLVYDEGTWTVPAGSFDAVRVFYNSYWPFYYAPDLGLLENYQMELMSWE